MKVAIPSNDGLTVNSHFGRSIGFRIFEIEGTMIKSDSYLKNDFTGHAQGMHHEHHGEHTHGEGGGHHSHQGIFNALGNVDAVIAGGMGRRLFEEFAQRKIDVYVTQEASIETALSKFMANDLESNPEICCHH